VQNGKVSVFELGAELLGAKVDGVIAYGASHIDSTLQQALSALKPGGFVALYVPVNGGVKDEEVDEKLMLSGFINSKTSKSADFAEFSATKPDWEVGASQKLNLKKPANSLSAQDAKNIWSSKATGAEEELIDEDELLDEMRRTLSLTQTEMIVKSSQARRPARTAHVDVLTVLIVNQLNSQRR
jgi:hypothetical protein